MTTLRAVEPVSLFIAMPCYGGIEPAFVESLLLLKQYLLRTGIEHQIEFMPGESLITRARNRMVWKFLNETKLTHLLFLDVDLMFHPTAILRLLGSGHEVCAAPYAKKLEGAGLVGNIDPKPGSVVKDEKTGATSCEPQLDRDGWAKAKDAGTGCMLIARTAFEKMIARKLPDDTSAMCPYACDLTPGGAQIYPFFDCGPEDGRDPNARYLSEDWMFCRLWQVVGGGDVWLDTRAKIAHVGRKVFAAPSFAEAWRAA